MSLYNEQAVGLLGDNTMEARAEHQKTRNYRTIYTCTTALGAGLVIMVLSWVIRHRGGFAWSSDPKTQFNWHPVLMTTGMIFIFGQSILAYRTGRSCQKRHLKLFHAAMNILAFILAVIGLKAAFDSHNLATPPIGNLYTFHSWLGLTAVILFSGQFLVGFISFLYPGLSKTMRQYFLPVHTAIGVGTFMLALLAAISGLTEKTLWTLKMDYEKLPAEGILLNCIAVFLAFFGILTLYLVSDVDFKRTSLPEDEVSLTEH